jgi:cytochrome bd-type quinol oxidase subunit 2
MANFVLAALLFAPFVLTFLLKSNAALSFLALCVGFVLSTSVIGDLKQLLSEINLTATESTLALIILIAPTLVTLLLTRKSSAHKVTFWLQLVAALAVGGLLALLAGPVISDSSSLDISSSTYFKDLQSAQTAIVGIGATFSLLLVWSTHLKHPKLKKKHKK